MSAGNAVTRTATNSTDTRIGWQVAAVVVCALVVVAYVLHAALPATPFTLPGPDAKTVRALCRRAGRSSPKAHGASRPWCTSTSPTGLADITAGPLAHPRDVMGSTGPPVRRAPRWHAASPRAAGGVAGLRPGPDRRAYPMRPLRSQCPTGPTSTACAARSGWWCRRYCRGPGGTRRPSCRQRH